LSRIAAVSTWTFGLKACERTIEELKSGASALDAVVCGIRVVEDDPSVHSVGYGGAPNSEGVVELDAAVMWGPTRQLGAVGALQDIKEAISVARLVMEKTPHNLLVGDGARQFAIEMGFEPCEMLTDEARALWESWKVTRTTDDSHDTVCVLGLDRDGNLAVGVSTSGLKFTLPGRVGDSPVVGSGFYCDNAVGAAAATGHGEAIMRYAMSFRVVEEMRRGLSPMDACRSTIEWAITDDPSLRERHSAVIALGASGEWGSSSTQEGFPAAVGDETCVELVQIGPP